MNELYRLQTSKLVFLQRQHRAATVRLNRRIIDIYTSEPTEALTVVLQAATFSELMDQLDYLNDIGRQDENIASDVKQAKLQMQETRNATRRTRHAVAEATRVVAARTAEQRAVRDRLAWSQRELATARRDKREALASVREDKEAAIGHMRDLELQSAALAAKIQSAQASAPAPHVDGSAVSGRVHLARARRRDERLRLALGPPPCGDRHRCRRRDAGSRGGRGGR